MFDPESRFRVAAVFPLLETFLAVALLSTSQAMGISAITNGNWSDPNTWDTVAVPTPADSPHIGKYSLVGDVTVTIDAGNAYSGHLWLGHSDNEGTLVLTNGATLTLSANTALQVGLFKDATFDCAVGTKVNGKIHVNNGEHVWDAGECQAVSNNSVTICNYNVPGPTSLTIDGQPLYLNAMTIGHVDTGTLILTNGATLTCTTTLLFGYSGESTLVLAPGTTLNVLGEGTYDGLMISDKNDFVVDAQNINQIGTIKRVQVGYADRAPGGLPATMTQDGVTLNIAKDVLIAAIGHDYVPALYRLLNGATLNTPTVRIHQDPTGSGCLRGWGTINLSDTFEQSGRVVADGGGEDNDLVITGYTSFVQNDALIVQADGTHAGWYAVDGGRLKLPAIDVPLGSSTQNWGETFSDTELDLVNSARIEFDDVAGGLLSVHLIATDRSDVSVTASNVVGGIWSFDTSDGFAFGSGGSGWVTFRYDDALTVSNGIDEADLQVWYYDGSYWREIATIVDTNGHVITGGPIERFRKYAVCPVAPGEVPPMGSVFVIR